MFTIVIHTAVMMSNRTDVACPACGHKEVFYYNCPDECTICKALYPDVKGIRDDLKKRKEWHFTKDDQT